MWYKSDISKFLIMSHCLVQMLTLCSDICISFYKLVLYIGKTHIHDSGSCGRSREQTARYLDHAAEDVML